MLLELDVV
jgi:hypothetical protein